jgi:hypothetical protein
MQAPNTPVMQAHDPDDDPFAALSAEVDSKQLVTPLEFGTGAAPPHGAATEEKKDAAPEPAKKEEEAPAK